VTSGYETTQYTRYILNTDVQAHSLSIICLLVARGTRAFQ